MCSSATSWPLGNRSVRRPAIRDRNDGRCRSAIRARHTSTVREERYAPRMRGTARPLDTVPGDRDIGHRAHTFQDDVAMRATTTEEIHGVLVGDRLLGTERVRTSTVRASVPAHIVIRDGNDGLYVAFDENVTEDSSHSHLFFVIRNSFHSTHRAEMRQQKDPVASCDRVFTVRERYILKLRAY